MSRTRQRIVQALTALSVTVFLLTVTAWVISDCTYFNRTPSGLLYSWGSPGRGHAIWLRGGLLNVQTIEGGRTMTLNGTTDSESLEVMSLKGAMGVHWYHLAEYKVSAGVKEGQPYWDIYNVDVELAWPLLLSLPLTILCVRQIVRQFLTIRNRSGLCSKCGYDLQATPDRCPECGLVVPHGDADISVA